jgi:hypothetical protein
MDSGMVFESFRSRQKTFLAFLAIAAMFAFIVLPAMNSYTGYGPEQGVVFEAWGRPVYNTELRQLSIDRSKLNEFLRRASIVAGFPSPVFQFPARDDNQLSAAIIFERKAKKLGIAATDDDVVKWLKAVVQDRLKQRDFADILSGAANYKIASETGEVVEPLNLPERTLFQLIKRELEIQRAEIAALPPVDAMMDTPIMAWRQAAPKLTEVRLEFIDVPVKDFLDESAQPTDEQIVELYERLKDQEADPAAGKLGFRLPRRVNVQYLEAKVDDFLDEVSVTDDEIASYYEEHKSSFTETPKPDVVPPPPAVPEPPAPPHADEPAAPDAEQQREPAPEPSPQPEGDAEPPAEDPPASKEETPPPDASPQAAAALLSTRPLNLRGAAAVLTLGASALLADEDADPAPPPADEPAADKPAATVAEPASGPNAEPTPALETGDEATPLPPEGAEPPSPTDAPPPEPVKAPQEPAVKPLDAVRDEIRTLLLRKKADTLVRERMQSIIDSVLWPYAYEKYNAARDAFLQKHGKEELSKFQPPPPPDLAKVAEENRLRVGVTGALTRSQFEQFEGLNRATRVDRRATKPESFTDVVFGGGPGDGLYVPRMVHDGESGAYYTIWKTEDLPPTAPPLEAVREQVVAAWRRERAEAEAKKQAEALAEAAKEAGGDLAKALPEGSGLRVQSTDRFPQVRTFPWPQQGTEIRLPVEIPQIPGAGEQFVNEVFQWEDGQVGVLPDAPRDHFYVVRLAERAQPDFNAFAREYRNNQRLLQQYLMRMRNPLREQMFLQTLSEAGPNTPFARSAPPPTPDDAAAQN